MDLHKVFDTLKTKYPDIPAHAFTVGSPGCYGNIRLNHHKHTSGLMIDIDTDSIVSKDISVYPNGFECFKRTKYKQLNTSFYKRIHKIISTYNRLEAEGLARHELEEVGKAEVRALHPDLFAKYGDRIFQNVNYNNKLSRIKGLDDALLPLCIKTEQVNINQSSYSKNGWVDLELYMEFVRNVELTRLISE